MVEHLTFEMVQYTAGEGSLLKDEGRETLEEVDFNLDRGSTGRE